MSRGQLFLKISGAFLVTAFFSGCIFDKDRFGTPNLLHPGHISEQRARMERFDPFPQVGMGPTVEGGRFPGADVPKPPVEHLLENYERGY